MDRKWWTLVVVCVAIFMLLLDITVVNVALPNIQRDLGANFTDLQWVIDAYALMLAAFLLTAGSLADRLGRKLLFTIGVGIFAAASLGCGLAQSPGWLDIARAVQGIGGALMFATSLSLLAQEFHGKERGTAFGIWGATTGASVAIGPLVGGALTDSFGWRSIFYINLPIALVAIVVALVKLRESSDPSASGIDWGGLATFSIALFSLVYALLRGNDEGWTSAVTLGLLGAAALCLLAFVVIELKVKDPMLELSLFRKPTFSGAQVAAFSLSASIFSMFLYLTLYLQNGLGYSPLQAGLRFLPVTILSFLVAPVAGKLSARLAPRLLLGAGLAIVALGLWLMHGIRVDSSWTTLLWGFLAAGIGVGMTNPPLASLAISVVPPRQSGMASGINSTFRQVGIATGIAALGALFQSHVQSAVESSLSGVSLPAGAKQGLAQAVSSGGAGKAIQSVPQAARGAVARAAESAFIGGLNELLVIAAIVAATGSVLTFVLVRRRDLVPSGESVPAAG